ncbi:MAG: RnfABCDGE type electron transport complex subunit G [Clostridia bacterium]|nr:RnfABCDGE type electron transport complex subunit G [Clostridia bacterium]
MRDIVKPAIVLVIVCIVVSVCLAFTYSVTRDKIEERARVAAESARKEVLSEAKTFEKVDGIEQIIKAKPEFDVVIEAYRGLNDNGLEGYVLAVETKGYGGIIKITVGVDNGGKVSGVKIGENNETPGLGTKAKDEPFMSQLVGLLPKEPLTVVKAKKTKPEEIEAISGATITSKAVVKAVQAAVGISEELAKKEGGQK